MQRRIVAARDKLTGDPPTGNVVKLASAEEWRLRVGDWRVRFVRDPQTGVVYVVHVLPRRRAYRD